MNGERFPRQRRYKKQAEQEHNRYEREKKDYDAKMAVGWENYVEEKRANVRKRFPKSSEEFVEAVMLKAWSGLSGQERMGYAMRVQTEQDDGTGETEVEI